MDGRCERCEASDATEVGLSRTERLSTLGAGELALSRNGGGAGMDVLGVSGYLNDGMGAGEGYRPSSSGDTSRGKSRLA